MSHPFDELVLQERNNPLPLQQLLSYWGSESGKLRIKRRKKILTETFKPNSILLEVGCGYGILTSTFDEEKNKVVQGDLIFDSLNHGVKKNWLSGSSTFCFDAHKLPFPDGTFDGIFGNAILHHLNPLFALKECLRILKPGGEVLFFEPNMANPYVWLVKNWEWLGKKYHETPGETAFFRNELADFASQAGFQDVVSRHFDFCVGPKPLLPLITFLEHYCETSFLKSISISLILKAQKP